MTTFLDNAHYRTLYSNASTSGNYDLNSLMPIYMGDWDGYSTRLERYDIYDGYYNNIAYHQISHYSQQLKVVERLYKHVRGVYNPVNRLVELYVAKIYGGILDTQNAESGAIVINSDNEAIRPAIAQLWRASQWGAKKSLYVRNGVKFGDTYLKVVDDFKRQAVYIEPVDPRKIKHVMSAPNGVIEEVTIEYYIGMDGLLRTYTEIITPEKFATFLDGEPYAFYANARGEMVAEWDNDYGFVPMVATKHRDVGMAYGANAYYYCLQKINELNDFASIVTDAARNQAEMPLVFKNVQGKTLNLDYGSDNSTNTINQADSPKRDSMRVLNIAGQDADIFPIPPTLDLSSALANIEAIEQELERDLPELALHRIRDGGNLTAPGVRSAYDDAIARIQEARGNYDTSLVEAQTMALGIGGMRGYDGYQGFNLMAYENGDLDHDIENRPVIADTLSLSEQINLTYQGMSANAPEVVYTKMGWGEEDAEEIMEAQNLQANRFMSGQLSASTPAPVDLEETAQEASTLIQERRMNEATVLDANALLESLD